MDRTAILILPILLFAGAGDLAAAPNISGSELPGRERQRFLESPAERFMQPAQPAEPLLRWQCEPGKTRSKQAKKQQTRC